MLDMQLYILLILTIEVMKTASKWRPTSREWADHKLGMVWVDGMHRHKLQIDTLFDRVVLIAYQYINDTSTRSTSHEATGVIIQTRLIVTSYNAFRTFTQKPGALKGMTVQILMDRVINETGSVIRYQYNTYNIECGRQVIPSNKNRTTVMPSHMKHGRHLPQHDLMVLRLDRDIEFITPIPEVVNDFNDRGSWSRSDEDKGFKKRFGAIRTELARPKQELGENLKFASIGHLNVAHIKENRYLELGKIRHGDKIIEDCDEWLPREWGRFICILNVNNYPGIAAGATLFSDTTLFGIGAFKLGKEKSSVLVFTDVRPYWPLLHKTCTVDDQNLKLEL